MINSQTSPNRKLPVQGAGMEPLSTPVTNHEKEFKLRDFFRLLGNRKTTIIGCTVILAVFMTFVALASQPVYEASALFQITSQAGALSILSDLLPGGSGTSPTKTEIEIVKSRSISLAVIDQLNLKLEVVDGTYGGPFSNAVMFVLKDRLQRRLRGIRFDAVSYPPESENKHLYLTYTDDSGNFRVNGPSGALGTGRMNVPFVSDTINFTVTSMTGPAGTKFRLSPRDTGETLRSYSKRLTVNSVGGATATNLIEVLYRDSNPELAGDVVNAIVDEYERRNTEWKSGLGASQTELIETRLSEIQSQLEEAETALADYKNQYGIVALPEEAIRAVADLATREAQKTDLDLRISMLQEIHTNLAGGLEGNSFAVPPALTGDPVIQQLAADHSKLTVELNDLLLDYTESHPAVSAKREAILTVRENILAAIASTTRGLIEQRQSLDGVIFGMEQNLYAMPGVERTLVDLTRQRDVANNSFMLLSARLDEARLVSASYQVGNRIIDRAATPDRVVSPIIKRNLGMGLGLGFILGIFLAFLLEISDLRLRRPDQLEDLLNGNPLAIIRNGSEQEIARAAGAIALSMLESDRKTIALLSPGEISDSVQKHIEQIITELSRGIQPVLVIDTSRRRENRAIFGVDLSPGLMEIAGGAEVSPQTIEKGRIMVLPSGADPTSVMVTNPAVREKISTFQERAGLTVFAISGFAGDPGLRGWAQMTQGAVLVLQRNQDRQDEIFSAMEALRSSGVPVVAALFFN